MPRLIIKRGCSIKILSRALLHEGTPLVALLMPAADDCEPCIDKDQLQARLDANSQAIIVYNQQADAISLVQSLRVTAAQIYIEIRQDTRGVLGLHASRNEDDMAQTIELVYH